LVDLIENLDLFCGGVILVVGHDDFLPDANCES
jgi:hypothetical protein